MYMHIELNERAAWQQAGNFWGCKLQGLYMVPPTPIFLLKGVTPRDRCIQTRLAAWP